VGAQIEVVRGNMFDGPTDLVVIPCSTVPTITWFVAEHLGSFGIPTPRGRMQLGEIRFAELQRASNVAQVAAYAASVRRSSTSSETIELIGQRLGSYCAENPWLGQISCPLLGAGAGGLEPTEAASALAKGYLATAPERALLRLFVLEDTVFDRIRSLFTSELGDKKPDHVDITVANRPLRVFISYTKSTGQHGEWVKAIATHLRSVGVDARLDVWHLRPGMDLPQWMSNELDIADRVLLICDELYAQKADGRHGGVGWEIRIIQGDLLQSQDTNPDKFVPVVVTENIADGMPGFIRAVYCIHWPPSKRDDSSLKDELVQIIYRAQEEAPPLGRPPAYVVERN
jgi:TIR domain-containing protein